MAELQTLARPYAEAAFKLATEAQDVPGWLDALERMAAAVAAAQALALVGHPRVPDSDFAAALAEAAAPLSTPQRAFLQVLVANERLAALPHIATQFASLRWAAAGVLQAEIRSAFPLSPEQLAEVVATLEAQHARQVRATVTVDPDLIGGISIRIGDEVFDASVRGKLAQLADVLMN